MLSKKMPWARPGAQHHEERDRRVDRVGRGVVAVGVGVPHREAVAAELPAALVELADLLAESVDVLVVAQALPDLDALARDRGAEIRVVLVQRLAGSRGERDAERRVLHRDSQRPCRDDRLIGADLEGRARVAEVLRDDRVGMVPTELLRGRDAHADDVGCHDADRRDGLVAAEQQRLAGALGRAESAECRPAGERGSAGERGQESRERHEPRRCAKRPIHCEPHRARPARPSRPRQ